MSKLLTHYTVEPNKPDIITFTFISFIRDYLKRQALPQLRHGFRHGGVIFLIQLDPYEYS